MIDDPDPKRRFGLSVFLPEDSTVTIERRNGMVMIRYQEPDLPEMVISESVASMPLIIPVCMTGPDLIPPPRPCGVPLT